MVSGVIWRGFHGLGSAFGAAALCVMAMAANAGGIALGGVDFTCSPDPQQARKIDPKQAELLCAAAKTALQNLPAPHSPPALRLIVTSANDRSAGLAGTWVFANGQGRSLAPLRTSFFDTTASPALHSQFVQLFFQANPIPDGP